MALVAVTDVAIEIGRPIPNTEAQQVSQWIDRVTSRIYRRIPDLDERVADSNYRESVRGVIIAVVARKVINPEGMRSERIDDYYYDRGSSSADLWPTDDEWAELLPDVNSSAFSTRPRFEPDRQVSSWLQ